MSRQLALPHRDPPAPPPGAPIVECVLLRSRVRVRVLDAGAGRQPEDIWCAFPERLRVPGAKFAVRKLTVIRRQKNAYYRASGPYFLLAPGGIS